MCHSGKKYYLRWKKMLFKERANLKQVKEIIIRELRKENPYSIFLWGPPGVGKSELVKQIHEETKIPMVDIRLLNYDPTDLKGIPHFETTADGKRITRWSPPSFLRDEKMIIFLDEITTAPEVIQGIAYQISLDKRIGEHEINKSSLIIAASNRPEDETIVFIPPAALSNRFIHLEVEVDVDIWLEYAREKQLSSYVTGFISCYKEHLFKMPKDDKGSLTSPAFPTPRAWTRIGERLHDYEDDKDLLRKFVYGNVGDGTGGAFISYYNVCPRFPPIEQILEGKRVEIELRWEVMWFVADILLRKADSKNIGNILKFLFSKIYPRGKEIVMTFIENIKKAKAKDKDFILALQTAFDYQPEVRQYKNEFRKYIWE